MTSFEAIWRGLFSEEGPFETPAGPDLPAVAVNMVMSVDGATSIDGRVGALTGPIDQALLRALRFEADAVLVGAGTVRAEGYGALLGEADRDRRARERGAAEPVLCVVTAGGWLPPGSPALGRAPGLLVFLTASADAPPAAARPVLAIRETEPAPGLSLRLRPLLGRLRDELGIERVVCEGGPTLNAALFAEGLVSELFLSLSPVLARQAASLDLGSGAGSPVALRLLGHAAADGYLFLRYRPEPS